MKLTGLLGLPSARSGRTTVPVRRWVASAVVVAAVAMGLLVIAGVSTAWAVPAGTVVGLFLAVPISTALTLRGR